MRVLLSLFAINFEVGVKDSGVEAILELLGKLARLVRGAIGFRAVGGVSSRLIDTDFIGVLLAK